MKATGATKKDEKMEVVKMHSSSDTESPVKSSPLKVLPVKTTPVKVVPAKIGSAKSISRNSVSSPKVEDVDELHIDVKVTESLSAENGNDISVLDTVKQVKGPDVEPMDKESAEETNLPTKCVEVEESSVPHPQSPKRNESSVTAKSSESGDEDADDEENNEEMTPRNKRAAAVMAKTKLNTRGHLNEGELQKDLLAAGILVSADESNDDAGKRGNKSIKKATSRGVNVRGQKKEAVEALPAEEKFACCDICEKWRKLPQHVDTSELPEKWVCSMNIWDESRNSCDAPEEEFPEPEISSIPMSEDIEQNKNHNRSRGSSKKRKLEGGDEDDEMGVDSESKRRGVKSRLSLDSKSPKSETRCLPVVPEQWVQCDKCSKWRKVAPGIDPDDLPKTWYCSMNTWNPQFSRCSARQEKSQDKYGSSTEDLAIAAGRKHARKPGSAVTASTPASSGVPAPIPNVPVKKVTQWVQCERKNCQKWRKVPAHIDMETMPEKWYRCILSIAFLL